MRLNPGMLFGTIAVHTGALSPDQIESLLEEQSRDSVPLGELCERRRLLSPNQVRSLLEAQRTGAFPQEDSNLGALAVRNGFASPEDVALALEAQRRSSPHESPSGAKLGQILLAMGILTHQRLRALLSAQARLRNGEPGPVGELDADTREIPILSEEGAADACAWLIQETAEGKGETFPLASRALIGRLPSHDIPVADMGCSRHHARLELDPATARHVLVDLESRNGTYVNGERLSAPRALGSGDRIRIGETRFRYASALPPAPAEIHPPAAPASQPAPAPPRPRLWERIAPGIHLQRKAVAAAAWLGAAATFLPWRHAPGRETAFGFRDAGAATLALFAAGAALALLRDRARPLPERWLRGTVALFALAALVGIWRLLAFAADPAVSAGAGVPLAILAGLGVPVGAWLARARETAAEPRGRLWSDLKGTTVRIARATRRLVRGRAAKPDPQAPSAAP
jgi:hypothetical protein